MEPEVLNRIGIILNFLAGFLLAPELLGTERLKKLEDFLERAATQLAKYSSLARSAIKQFSYDFTLRKSKEPYSQPSPASKILRNILILIAVMFAILTLVNYIIYPPARLTDRGFDIWRGPVHPMIEPVIYWLTWLFLYLGIGFPFLLTITWVMIEGTVFLARLLVNKLAGENQLRSSLVWMGIICFIAGNTLQFVATF